ncbi:MAG: 2-amino-4-hydroxy-6-hydroxymethyldihydropteridine diphosphokinase [Chloroflexi bacterium]|nr:2-amino-4-hydroxy-6-hydroxymethyldihydropteridine diphosphokinase [Chloroflexota bacterium]
MNKHEGMNEVILMLGSNIDKELNIPQAVQLLREMCDVVAVSAIYETGPVGLLEQPNFWNTAVLIHTPLAPAQIKKQLIGAIERNLRRVRQADPNAPRTIDVDIVLFNDDVIDYEGEDGRLRHIPDKDLCKFTHVAVPVAELLPDKLHPETGQKLMYIAEKLVERNRSQTGNDPIWIRPDSQLS